MTAGLVSSQFCLLFFVAKPRDSLTKNSNVRGHQKRSRRSTRTRNPRRRPCKVKATRNTAIPLEQSSLLIPDACVIVFRDSMIEKAKKPRSSKKSRNHSPPIQVLLTRIITSDILIVRYLSFNAEQEHRQSCLFVEITGYTAQTCCED
jgi:hypothetical protein